MISTSNNCFHICWAWVCIYMTFRLVVLCMLYECILKTPANGTDVLLCMDVIAGLGPCVPRIHFNIRLYHWKYSLCSDRQAGVITALHLQGKWLCAVTVVELVMRSCCHFYQQGLQGGCDKMDIPPSALIPSAPLSIPFTYPRTEWGILLSIAKRQGRFLHY